MTARRAILATGAIAALMAIGGAAQAASPTQAPPLKIELSRVPAHAHRGAPVVAPQGAVASLVNVQGLRPGQLVLSGRILADIYAGRITRWDAPQIAHWNPGVALPHATIVVIRQQDASATNFAFTSFLAAQTEIGRRDGSPASLTGAINSLGDADVAAAVRRTENSIGYVDYRFAVENGLPLTKVITRQGVSPILAPPMIAASRSEAISSRSAVTAADAPTLGKLSFIANPPNVLGQMGRGEDSSDSPRGDNPN